MVLKFSGSYRQCKGGSSSYRSKSFRQSRYRRGGGSSSSYPVTDDDDAASDGGGGGHYAFLRPGSSSSTPAWDFTSIASGGRGDDRFKANKWIPGVGVVAMAEQEVVLEEDDEPKEWMAQVEPGVHITFVSLPGGAGNDLKRIRFRSNSAATGKGTCYPTVPDPSEHIFPHHLNPSAAAAAAAGVVGSSGVKGEASSLDASRTTTSSRDEASVSISNASDLEVTEWVEQDEPGVYITIRELADGTRELRRVRFR
ncbi:protein BREVIS RADIX-like [Cocos nucifera]|uniref:Protein BREVIS RADIX-like n=1 Tax=Cocos nucifera TaxID=13894 RepID=A0A8K0IGY8_COCNU|nr:protein BREVIS RADIX-like [Cocos nucifera]